MDDLPAHIAAIPEKQRDAIVAAAQAAAAAAPPMTYARAARTAARCGLVLAPQQPQVLLGVEGTTTSTNGQDDDRPQMVG